MNKNYNSERYTDGFYLKERRDSNGKQITIFDGKGELLGKSKDSLLYNINGIDEKGELNNSKRIKQFIKNTSKHLGKVFWVDFTYPGKKLIRIDDIDSLEFNMVDETKNGSDLGYADNVIIIDTHSIMKELGINQITLGGAVADCGAICGTYNNGEIISLSHAGWRGILNGVIEQIIYTYKAELGNKEFQKVQFNISPMAGENYEWNEKEFDINILLQTLEIKKQALIEIKTHLNEALNNKDRTLYKEIVNEYYRLEKEIKMLDKEFKKQKFANIAYEYNIDFFKDKIVEKANGNPKKVIFYLDRLIKRIFLENGVHIEQLNFHKDYTTSLNNIWPSYRIHSLGKNGIITENMTLKSENGIIHNSRIGVFNSALLS